MTDPYARSLRPRWRRRGVQAFVSAALVAALAACSPSSGGDPTATSGDGQTTGPTTEEGNNSPAAGSRDTLVIANGVAIDDLDPQVNSANETIWLVQSIYSRLVQASEDGTEIEPDLAESWDISPDGLTYTFHLRDAQFADGTPVTADDVVWSIERANAYEGGWGFLLEKPVKSITATDPKTVTFSLNLPHAPLLADLALYAYGILPKAAVESNPDFFNKPYGAGPFMVESMDPTTEVDMVVNPHWYGAKPNISNVKIKIITDDNARVLALQAGDVDVIENPPGNAMSQIDSDPNLQATPFPSTRVDFMFMNNTDPILSDMRVRQAIQSAIDFDQMNQVAYQGTAVPGSSFMPYQMMFWNASLGTPKRDLDKAKQLLSDAGHPGGGFSLSYVTVAGDAAGNAQALTVQQNLKDIGITVNIEAGDQTVTYGRENQMDYQLGQRYWTNDIIDPDQVTTFAVDVTASGSFHSQWDNAEAAKLVNDARSETDSAQRQKAYERIQEIVYNEVPYIPLAYPPFRYAQGKWVDGFRVSPLGNYNHSLLTLTVADH
ncbi:MAG: ABC transporter substrate-binding protein [Propionibacteriaceae bacterium]|nr:ABC transporter substrate-binding protein [Propionibacteriaceae bacterium]